MEKFFWKIVEKLLRLLVSEFEKLTLWGIILGAWSILFIWVSGWGWWENILDRCGWGWVGVSGVGALFDNGHWNPTLEKKTEAKKTSILGLF